MPKSVNKIKEEIVQKLPEPVTVNETPYKDVRDPWKVKSVKFYTSFGAKIETECPQYGVFIILWDTFNDAIGMYTLYAPNSLTSCVDAVKTLEDAMQIGEILWQTAPAAFRLTEREEIREALPPWVGPWIKRCKEAKGFVEVME